MRRVIRHIFTVVTSERWSLNWERVSEEEIGSRDDGSEQLLVEVKSEPFGKEHMEGKLSEERTEE